MTLQEFITDHGLTMTTEPVPENPYMNGGMLDGSRHYHCTIKQTLGSRHAELKCYFSVGPGIVEHWVSKHGKRQFVGGGSFTREQYNHNRRTIAASEFFDANAKKYPGPELVDVLDCLASDASSVEQSDFEDWAADMGWDSDSRKVLATYQICEKQAKQLRHLVEPGAFETLLYEIERL